MKNNKKQLTSVEHMLKAKGFDEALFNETYAFWQNEWNAAFKEQGLNGISADSSDKFVNADEILVFRVEREIIAIALVNHIDLNLNAYKDIAYLKALPQDGWDFMMRKGYKKIMASGYNLVKKEYRKLVVGKTLISIVVPGLVAAMFERRPDFDISMGMPLTASGNDKTLTRIGLRDMHKDSFLIHDVEAKFMYVDKTTVDFGKYEHDIKSLLPFMSVNDNPSMSKLHTVGFATRQLHVGMA